MKIEMVAATDVGRYRKSNQDYLLIEPQSRFAIVADGIGGRKAGNVASKVAVTTLAQILREGRVATTRDIPPFLIGAVDQVNSLILETAAKKDHFEGMGTTMECMWFTETEIFVAHIGDSRTYLYFKENLWPLTVDHNVQTFVEKGWLKESVGKKAKQSAMVRALGLEERCECDVYSKSLIPGEIYLSASDGLFDMVKDQQIAKIISKNYNNLKNVAQQLILAANKNGGRDNISLAIARVHE